MTPVFQTMFVHEHGTGNCFNACIASMLDLPLDQVADILPTDKGDWEMRWKCWLAERGLKLEMHLTGDEDDVIPAGYSIGSAFTERRFPEGHPRAGRSIFHAFIVLNGEIVHDPFPGGSKIKEISYYKTIEPMTPTELNLHRYLAENGFCVHGYKRECKVC